jgi:hypothetical protein
MLNTEISSVFGYQPGMDLRVPPPLSVVPEEELGAYKVLYEDIRTA